MSLVSQDNQDLLWDLIAETGILHTVDRRIFPDRVLGNLFIINACLKNATGPSMSLTI